MNHITDTHIKPQPTPDADSHIYWSGIQNGKLLLQYCLECDHRQLYQQVICRECGGDRLEHRSASGRGKVHSFSVVYRAPSLAFKKDIPYAVLLVELEEGPRMISSFVGADPSVVTFEMEVELVCEPETNGLTLPRFRRISS
ncbi:OB-fold domain-containing protein [Limnohabitans sp. Rim8]|uniref:Zn-ribbon domain-containing OB-fold protein n=1 Tax=Limnohabitans sp. Rim8 TaxID=1100718 RepID=UPI003305F2F2